MIAVTSVYHQLGMHDQRKCSAYFLVITPQKSGFFSFGQSLYAVAEWIQSMWLLQQLFLFSAPPRTIYFKDGKNVHIRLLPSSNKSFLQTCLEQSEVAFLLCSRANSTEVKNEVSGHQRDKSWLLSTSFRSCYVREVLWLLQAISSSACVTSNSILVTRCSPVFSMPFSVRQDLSLACWRHLNRFSVAFVNSSISLMWASVLLMLDIFFPLFCKPPSLPRSFVLIPLGRAYLWFSQDPGGKCCSAVRREGLFGYQGATSARLI